MKKYTANEIREHRQAWIDYLKRPKTKKTVKQLESVNDPEARCCLGHACHVMGATRKATKNMVTYFGRKSIPSPTVVNYFGLWNDTGHANNRRKVFDLQETICGRYSLVILNDDTDTTPQEIGEYLQSVIEGGDHTPFIPLTDYENV